jgi:hypothetical protein
VTLPLRPGLCRDRAHEDTSWGHETPSPAWT